MHDIDTRISIRELRTELASVVARVQHVQHRMLLTRNGTPVAALVSIEDLNILKAFERISGIAYPLPQTGPVDAYPPGGGFHNDQRGDATHDERDDVGLPTHFGIYGSRFAYHVHAENPVRGKRMLMRRIESHADTGSVPEPDHPVVEELLYGEPNARNF